MTANGVVEHKKNNLTLESYLKLADRKLTRFSYQKHATYPLWPAQNLPEELYDPTCIRIGISISAGNRAKKIPPQTWLKIFTHLHALPCRFYIFGQIDEMDYLHELRAMIGNKYNIVSLIGKLNLEDVPAAISQMDLYIASDSGNVYIADTVAVPIILFYGPCSIEEQHPLGEVLLVGPPNITPSTFIFAAKYEFEHPLEALYGLNRHQLDEIYTFVIKHLPARIKLAQPS